jgi:hypothetical protein
LLERFASVVGLLVVAAQAASGQPAQIVTPERTIPPPAASGEGARASPLPAGALLVYPPGSKTPVWVVPEPGSSPEHPRYQLYGIVVDDSNIPQPPPDLKPGPGSDPCRYLPPDYFLCKEKKSGGEGDDATESPAP